MTHPTLPTRATRASADAAAASPAARRWALALLLVLAFAASWSRPGGREEQNGWPGPARALELVTPGVFAEIRPAESIELNMARPALLGLGAGGWESHPDAAGRVDPPPPIDPELREALAELAVERLPLPTRAADVPLPPHGVPYVGLLPLLLALLGVLAGNHVLAWLARATLAASVCLMWATRLHAQHVGPGTRCGMPGLEAMALPGAQGLLVLAAVCGLAWLHGLDDEHDGASAPIVVGSLSVLLCGALMVLAARLGTSEPGQAVAALGERITAAGGPAPTRPALLATAEHLTRLLEEAALVSFAAMSALLLHLKGRGRWTLLALLAVALLDVARPLTGRWLDLLGALFGG